MMFVNLVVVSSSVAVARGIRLVLALSPSVADAAETSAETSVRWCVGVFGNPNHCC